MGTFSIDFVPLTQETGVSQQQHFKEINAGAGTSSFGLNDEGLRMGSTKFSDAPFKFDYAGNTTITGGTLTGTNVVTNNIKDATYSLNGVFCYTATRTATSGTFSFSTGIPDTGGLLNASLNYTPASDTTQYKMLPGFDTASVTPYFYVYKSGGFYRVFYYASNIYAAVTHNTLYFTLTFNSLETSGW